MPAMPSGDAFAITDSLLKAEGEIRAEKKIRAVDFASEPYWADIIRLRHLHTRPAYRSAQSEEPEFPLSHGRNRPEGESRVQALHDGFAPMSAVPSSSTVSRQPSSLGFAREFWVDGRVEVHRKRPSR